MEFTDRNKDSNLEMCTPWGNRGNRNEMTSAKVFFQTMKRNIQIINFCWLSLKSP